MSSPPSSPKSLQGSDEAKRKLAVFLEALAGVRTIQSASEELGVAVVRYYVLEARMLQAMVDALEPQRRGPKKNVEVEMSALRDRCKELERELLRLKALYRTTQRAVGVKASPKTANAAKSGASGGKKRRPRKVSRAARIAKTVRPRADGNTIGQVAAGPGGNAMEADRPAGPASEPAPQTAPAPKKEVE